MRSINKTNRIWTVVLDVSIRSAENVEDYYDEGNENRKREKLLIKIEDFGLKIYTLES